MLLAAPQHANATAFDHRVVPTGAYILRITLTGYRNAIRTVAGSRQEDIGAWGVGDWVRADRDTV